MCRCLYIVCLTLLGFLITPTEGFACGPSQETSENTHTKDCSSHMDLQDCCKKADASHGEKGCDGSCCHTGCHCPTVFLNHTIAVCDQFVPGRFIKNKTSFYYQETFGSSGVSSIWQPPKIG